MGERLKEAQARMKEQAGDARTQSAREIYDLVQTLVDLPNPLSDETLDVLLHERQEETESVLLFSETIHTQRRVTVEGYVHPRTQRVPTEDGATRAIWTAAQKEKLEEFLIAERLRHISRKQVKGGPKKDPPTPKVNPLEHFAEQYSPTFPFDKELDEVIAHIEDDVGENMGLRQVLHWSQVQPAPAPARPSLTSTALGKGKLVEPTPSQPVPRHEGKWTGKSEKGKDKSAAKGKGKGKTAGKSKAKSKNKYWDWNWYQPWNEPKKKHQRSQQCKYFKQDNCRNGAACRMRHGINDPRFAQPSEEATGSDFAGVATADSAEMRERSEEHPSPHTSSSDGEREEAQAVDHTAEVADELSAPSAGGAYTGGTPGDVPGGSDADVLARLNSALPDNTGSDGVAEADSGSDNEEAEAVRQLASGF